MPQKIAVVGWYGHHNFGDELMLEGLKCLFQNSELTVMSDGNDSNCPTFNPKTANICDLLVLGGGELIGAKRLFLPGNWVNKVNVPKIILGCGVNAESPKQINRSIVKQLEQFDYIGLRDKVAVEILQSFPHLKDKVHLFYDLVYSLGIKTKCSPADLAVVIPTDRFTNQYDRGVKAFDLAVSSQAWLKDRLGYFGKTVFLPFGQQDNNDFKTCTQLASCACNSAVFYPEQITLTKVIDVLSISNCVFTYRLHGLILSHIMGLKCEFYPYHWKLNRVSNTISGISPCLIQSEQKKALEVAL